MKKITTILALMLVATISNAQTMATDFTATDCKGNSHNLFTELYAEKVIALVWVMPCSMCIGGGDAAFSAVQSFATSNPGKVLYYLIDDAGNTSCSALAAWATTNGIDTSKIVIFDNAGSVINESNYGGSGMPHIVVVGPDHKIYFNEKNGTGTGVQAAIQTAINPTNVSEVVNQTSFSTSPNPVSEKLSISHSKAILHISVSSLTGQIVKEENFTEAKMNPSVNLSDLAKGMYVVRITDVEGKNGIQEIIKN